MSMIPMPSRGPSRGEGKPPEMIEVDVEVLDARNHAVNELLYMVKDLVWKATPLGIDAEDDDAIKSYAVPAGALHRLAGAAQGMTTPNGVGTISFRGAP